MPTAEENGRHVHADGSHEEHLVPRLSLVPHRHTKVIHFIRHGQGFHNVAGHQNHDEYKNWAWEDAHLTDFGWQQAEALGAHIRGLGSSFRADVVIVSPLTRTLETAAGVFGTGRHQQGDPQPPLMLEQSEVAGRRAAHQAISAAGCPPFVAWEGCREHLGVHPCDRRRPMREIKPSFPAVDFSLIESEEDVLWEQEHREGHEEIRLRGVRFLHWLMGRPEQHVAVVAHGGFLYWALSAYGASLGPPSMLELHRWYDNCEMRTVVMADEGGAHRHPDPLHFRGGHHI